MFDVLLEKLRKITEVVATASAQKSLLSTYGSTSGKRLVKSDWPGEHTWRKFWLLTNGKLVAVNTSHARTAVSSNTTTEDLHSEGAFAGYVIDGAELGLYANKFSSAKYTSQQIITLRNLYIQYKPVTLFADFEKQTLHEPIKSSKDLEYLLTYGTLDEATQRDNQIEKEQFFLDRTNKHIELVQEAAAKIVEAYPELSNLLKQVEQHDESKFREPEITPYIEITWRHKLEKENDEFDPYNGKGYQTPGELEKAEENAATIHHITTNSHHPEFHLEDKDDANINAEDRNKSDKVVDALLMPELDIAEMVADWQAMSEELQTNTAREWFEKQRDVRWHFSDSQVELIDKLLSVFENNVKEAGNLTKQWMLFEKDTLDIWLNHPDMFELGSGKYEVKRIPLNKITDVGWTVTADRKEMEKIFRSKEKKLPLILVEEKDNGDYELFDGQHRYAAYVNVFPNVSYIKVATFKKKKKKNY